MTNSNQQRPSSGALARKQPPRSDLRQLLSSDRVRGQLALALPKTITPERMMRVALTSVNRTPKLLECSPESVLSSLMQAAQMGIEVDGRNGHLVPFWDAKKGTFACQFIPDYKGLVSLVRRNPRVADVYAEVVCEADTFSITKGLHRDLRHEIDVRQPRGKVLGAYAVIAYRDGSSPSFEWMGVEEIDAVRSRSKSGDHGPWGSDYAEMCKKTVVKRLMKYADLTPEQSDQISADPDDARTTEVEIREVPPARPARNLLPAGPDESKEPAGPPAAAQEPPSPRRVPARRPRQEAPPIEPEEVRAPAPPPSPADEIRARLRQAGYEEDDLVLLCVDSGLLDQGARTIDDLPEERAKLILDDWESVAGDLDMLKRG